MAVCSPRAGVMGALFAALFDPRDDLFLQLASHTNDMAAEISQVITEAGYDLVAETETNQVCAILPMPLVERLQEHFVFYVWGKLGTRDQDKHRKAVVRLVTSWATDPLQVQHLADILFKWK